MDFSQASVTGSRLYSFERASKPLEAYFLTGLKKKILFQDEGENEMRQSTGSHEVGTHFVPATNILAVTLDTCHPGLPPG